MKRLLITLFLALFIALPLGAQEVSSRPFFLGLEGGVGLGSFRDYGASPLVLRGPELLSGVHVERCDTLWRWDAGAALAAGGFGYSVRLSSLFAYGGQLSVHAELLRRMLHGDNWRLWAGVRVDDLFDIRYNSQLSNASVGMSNFIRPRLTSRAEYAYKRWIGYAQLWADPMAVLLRPGFSYVNNYDRDVSNPVACAFDQYEWYLAGCTGLATQVGVRYSLRGGNEVGAAYYWQYVTSRQSAIADKAPWRFQQATHGLVIQLLFLL